MTLRTFCAMVLLLSSFCCQLVASESKPDSVGRYNVLFVVVDDLKPRVGCYGDPVAKTPNIDRLASDGMLFERAYCQQALCSPSRTSVLTGLRPDTTGIYELATHFRKNLPNTVTLPQHFMRCGYHSQGLSKIYHSNLDDPKSWSVPWRTGQTTKTKTASAKAPRGQSAEVKAKVEAQEKKVKDQTVIDPGTGTVLYKPHFRSADPGSAIIPLDVPDNALRDGQTAETAIDTLRQIKDKRFFLAVGFLKPHLPFEAPKKYFDMYPLDKIQPAPNSFPPKDVPQIALSDSGELRNYTDIPDVGPVDRDLACKLIQGYYAATTYTDTQIGKLLDELQRLGLKDNTIVVLWGDHGWQLGEHDLWCKHTNFEEATRGLLLVSVPGQKNRGARTRALVEFVDLYPTLCELCGLPVPGSLEGTSFVPVLDDPARSWKTATFSQYPRGKKVMGHSMRTEQYRYTEWKDRTTSEVVGVELYDHKADPQENTNIAVVAENKELVAKLAKQLASGWKQAKPPGK